MAHLPETVAIFSDPGSFLHPLVLWWAPFQVLVGTQQCVRQPSLAEPKEAGKRGAGGKRAVRLVVTMATRRSHLGHHREDIDQL